MKTITPLLRMYRNKDRFYNYRNILKTACLSLTLGFASAQTATVITDFNGSEIASTIDPSRSVVVSGNTASIAFDATTAGQLYNTSNTKHQFRGGIKVVFGAGSPVNTNSTLRAFNDSWNPGKFMSYTDNSASSSTYNAVLLWTKDKFLGAGSTTSNDVTFDNNATNSYITINVTEMSLQNRELRFVVKNGGNYYISEFAISATGLNTFSAFNNSSTVGKRWGLFNPSNLSIPSPLPSFSALNLNSVTEIGLVYTGSRPNYGHGFSFSQFKVSALVGASGPAGPAGYSFCSAEGQICLLSGTQDIAYGANGTFNYLYNQSGSISCNNGTFGDPIYGVAKSCFVKNSTVDTQAPTVPTGLSSSAIGQTSFSLNWTASTDNVGVTAYEIFRNGVSIGTSTTNSFAVSGLTAGTSYNMTVRARDAAGNYSSLSAALTVATQTLSTKAPLGAGLDGIADYNHSRWFVDAMKYARVFGLPNQPWNEYTGTYSPTTYYPTQSFGLVILSGVNPTYESFLYGTYKLSFKGSVSSIGTVASGGVTVTNLVYNSATNTSTADVNFPSGGDQIMLNFINPVNVDDMKMISPGYPVNNPPLLRTEMKNIINNFNQLRFMDWLETNFSTVVSWSDRHLPTLPGRTNRNNKSGGVAWEDIIRFANDYNKDIWINIPVGANNDYVTQCATLLKNGLNPNINVYIEFSNEIWNFSFGQFFTNLDAANAEVAAGSTLNNDGETNQYVLASRRVVKKSYEISNIFKNVWGASAINSRVRVVVAGQLYYSHGDDLAWFNATYGAPKNFFWGIANAPYWSTSPLDQNNLSATPGQLLDQLDASKDELFSQRNMEYPAGIATYYGLEFMGYEGGPDTFGPNNIQSKAALNFDPRMKTISVDFLNKWYKNGGKQFNWFTIGSGGGYDSQYGTWSLLGWLQDSSSNQKYQAIKQVANSPVPAVTAGLSVPSTNYCSQTLAYRDNFVTEKFFCGTGVTGKDMYLLNVANAGNYNLKVNSRGYGELITAKVYVNNVQVSTFTVATGNNISSSTPVNITLPKGLATLMIEYINPGARTCWYLQDFTISSGSAPRQAASVTPDVKKVTLYPNPTENHIFNLELPVNSYSDVVVYSIEGKKVMELHQLSGNNVVDMTNFTEGLYIVKVQGKENQTIKIDLK